MDGPVDFRLQLGVCEVGITVLNTSVLTPPPLEELTYLIKQNQENASQARTSLINHEKLIIEAVQMGAGQGQKLEKILMSEWNGEISENFAGLEPSIACAAVAIIAARAHMGGDADNLIRPILAKIAS